MALADVLSHALIASRGSFALTGENAGTDWGPKFAAAYGSFALTGEDATLSARGTFIEQAGVGHDVLTGMPVALTVGRKFAVADGSFVLSRQSGWPGGARSDQDHRQVRRSPAARRGRPPISRHHGRREAGWRCYRYAIFAGALPPGQSLNASTGAVTGTLTTAGTYSSIVIVASDAIGATANLAAYSITVSASMPASVIAAGLQSVWNLRNTAGLSHPATNTPGATALPAGAALASYVSAGVTYHEVLVIGSCTFTDWDFTGYEVHVNGNIIVDFTNCRFRYNGGYLLPFSGQSGGAPTVTCANCEFDGTGTLGQNESNVEIFNGSFSAANSWFHDPAVDSITMLSSGTCALTSCYFRAPGKGSISTSHLECIHWRNGTNTATNCLFDLTDGVAYGVGVAPRGGMTSVVFTEGLQGVTSTACSGCIMIGAAALHTNYTIQGGASTYTVSIVMQNCVLEKGTSGYFTSHNTLPTWTWRQHGFRHRRGDHGAAVRQLPVLDPPLRPAWPAT